MQPTALKCLHNNKLKCTFSVLYYTWQITIKITFKTHYVRMNVPSSARPIFSCPNGRLKMSWQHLCMWCEWALKVVHPNTKICKAGLTLATACSRGSGASLFSISGEKKIQSFAWIRTWNWAKVTQDPFSMQTTATPVVCEPNLNLQAFT